MADDLGFGSFWSVEQNFSFPSVHYPKIKDDHFLEKTKADLNIQREERVQNEVAQLELDDVLMLDDIREFSMKNGFTVSTEKLFHGDNLSDTEKSLSSPLKTSSSSQFTILPLKSSDEYLPNSASDMSHSDTFQDLSTFMPEVSAVAVTSNSYGLYSTSKSFSDTSSDSQFTNISYTNETFSAVEQSTSTEIKKFSTSDLATDDKTVSAELKIFKHSRHKDIRKKNNLASQRSRMTRKEREREMENKEKFLEQENQMLRIKVAKLEELTGALKNQLFRSVLGK